MLRAPEEQETTVMLEFRFNCTNYLASYTLPHYYTYYAYQLEDLISFSRDEEGWADSYASGQLQVEGTAF